MRWLAAEGLIRMRKASLKPIFQALIERSDSKWLREGAHHVLHALAKSGLDDRVAPVLAALEGIEPTATVPNAAGALDIALTDGAQRISCPPVTLIAWPVM